MALDERYVLLMDLESTLRDKDSGLPLANGNIYSYRDSAQGTGKLLYQLSGSPGSYTYTALPNPVPLSAVGTPQNALGDNVAIYMYPYITNAEGEEVLDLYYLSIKSSANVEQFTRAAWPNLTSGNDPTTAPGLVNNEISNAQFSRVIINSGATTYTFAAASDQEIQIAPDWLLIVSGTGTVIVEQKVFAGSSDFTTNPPYALEVTVSANISECRLTQRFFNNSGLWANDYLAGSFVARSVGGTGYGITMYYEESSGSGGQISLASMSATTSFTRTTNAPVLIPTSTNATTSATGYTDIYLSLGPSTKVQVTSVQVAPSTSGNALPYDERSSNREFALMSDYYTPRLIEKAIPSMLVGWDFPLNPRQFGATPNITATADYIYDQTIAVRSAGNMTTASSSVTSGLQVTTTTATDAFYLLQYLDGAQAKKILGTRLSVNVNAYKGTVGTSVTCRVYLYSARAAASIPTLATTIGTLAATGVFTLTAANWTEIPRSNMDQAQGTLSTVTTSDDINDDIDLAFSGWEMTDASQISDTDKFAIVVTFAVPTDLTVVTVNSISLVPGDIPTRPAPQTTDQVLRECQYYYEKSYAAGTAVGTATTINQYSAQQRIYITGGTDRVVAGAFFIPYKATKRAVPSVKFYSTSGTADSFTAALYQNGAYASVGGSVGIGNWSPTAVGAAIGVDSLTYAADGVSSLGASASGNAPEGVIFGHYVLDSRLGI